VPPHERGPGYDRSFLLGLSAAHAQGVPFGEQLIYPYGPLAYLFQPLPPSGALGLGLFVQLAVFAVFLVVLALLAWRIEGRWMGVWCLVVLGASALIDPMSLWLGHAEVLAPIVGVLAFATTPSRRLPVLMAMAGLAAGLLLVKLDAGVYATVLCAGLALHTARECRADRPAVPRLLLLPPAAFLVSLMLLYGIESGRLDTLPGFLLYSLHVMVGYKEMSVDGAPGRLIPMLAALGAVFIVLPLLVRDRRRLAPALLMILVPAFMLWQRVAMRQDEGHQTSFLPRLAVLLLFPLLALGSKRERALVGGLQVLVLVAGGVFVATQFPFFEPELTERVTGRQALTSAALIRDWDQSRADIEEASRWLGAPFRLGPKAREIVRDEPVDAVPFEIERVMAHPWRWSPRPALQSSNAYVPPLDRLDAEHFASDGAPRFVLADNQTIDERHIFLEAPLTWRALLDRYDLRAVFPAVLILERRSAPRFDPPRLLDSVVASWDQELEVPQADELVLLSALVRPGLAGEAVGLFYRNASVHLDVRYINGFELRWRAVRPNLQSGAIVSQMPLSRDGLSALFESGPGETDRVTSIRIHTDEPWQYDPELAVQWWALPLRAEERPWHAEVRPPDPVAAEWSLLGEDCADASRPVLRLIGEPRLGQAIEIVVEGAPPSSPVQLLIGAGAVELSGRWSTWYVDPDRMLRLPLSSDADGAARLSVSIPVEQRLVGLDVTIQAAVQAGPGAIPAWPMSCGLRIVIGR
jgi:hypothetical protein